MIWGAEVGEGGKGKGLREERKKVVLGKKFVATGGWWGEGGGEKTLNETSF